MNSRMSNREPKDMECLELISVHGFGGSVVHSLLIHPDREHMIYPLGNMCVIQTITTCKQSFLSGHTDNVTCVAVSKSGKYVATGQKTHMGFKADVIVWDYEEKKLKYRLTLHKVKVEALAFSPNDKFLVSLGGQDDGSVVIWDLEKGNSVCGSPAAVPSAGTTHAVTFINHRDDVFITGGNKTLRIWELDVKNRKIRPTECNTGQLKRIVDCIKVTNDDCFFYCGTTTGDILKVNIVTCKLLCYGPKKKTELFSQGVSTLEIIKEGDEEMLIIGTGDGTVALLSAQHFKVQKCKKAKLEGGVTSIALRGQGHQFFVGTSISNMYRFNFVDFTHELVGTYHHDKINDIVFPYACTVMFITCSKEEIRVWNNETSKELLRITVPNMTCNTIDIPKNGTWIASGWDDRKVRLFSPETGTLLLTIEDAHVSGVSAVVVNSECNWIISGGANGQVRVWDVPADMQKCSKGQRPTAKLVDAMPANTKCVSASGDGSCSIWDLRTTDKFKKISEFKAITKFKAACFDRSGSQIITAGTDKKIAYWDAFDGSQIRELEGSSTGSIDGMDISSDGNFFVTGGIDKLLKVWSYDEGKVTHLSGAHSGNITKLKICPLSKWIISVSDDGAIWKWRYPHMSESCEQNTQQVQQMRQ